MAESNVPEIIVISKTTITPSSPTPSHLRHFKLSLLDQLAPPSCFVPIVLFFSPSHHFAIISQTLKASLSEALTLYFPFSGRFRGNSNRGSAHVDCNDEGVPYIEAKTPLRLSDFLGKNLQPHDIKAFFPLDPYDPKSENDETEPPLMEVQVSEFSCGGVGIGACVSHRVCDGATMSSFLQAWSEKASLLMGSDSCVYYSSSPSLEASGLFPQREREMNTTSGMTGEKNIVTRRLMFSGKSLCRLRDELGSGNNRPTRVEAVTALMWKSAMEAQQNCSTSMMSHAVNIRRRMVPPLPENSIGNLWQIAMSPLVEADKATKNLELQDVLEVVRKSIRKIDEDYVRKLQNDEGVFEVLKSLKEVMFLAAKKGIPCYSFSSWTRFGFYEANFGWGRPTWVATIGVPIKNVAVLMPTSSGDAIEAWITLNDTHMPHFQHNPLLLQFASFDP